MTRVNCIDPRMLSNEHLFAEWREIPRIITAVEKLTNAGKALKDYDVPNKYKFGKGHVVFFYDKLRYIFLRLNDIRNELEKRGYNFEDRIDEYVQRLSSIPNTYMNNWKPSTDDIYLNMSRLVERKFKTKMKVEGNKIIEGEI